MCEAKKWEQNLQNLLYNTIDSRQLSVYTHSIKMNVRKEVER